MLEQCQALGNHTKPTRHNKNRDIHVFSHRHITHIKLVYIYVTYQKALLLPFIMILHSRVLFVQEINNCGMNSHALWQGISEMFANFLKICPRLFL